MMAQSHTQRGLRQARQAFAAQAYSVELMEFLRSHSHRQFKLYLARNPIDNLKMGGKGAYFLCAHINIIDRTVIDGGYTLRNPDPIAELPVSVMGNPKVIPGPNRFYMVQVVDARTLEVNKALCEKTARSLYLFGEAPVAGQDTELGEFERFFITVGVSWLPAGMDSPKRIAMSTMIP